MLLPSKVEMAKEDIEIYRISRIENRESNFIRARSKLTVYENPVQPALEDIGRIEVEIIKEYVSGDNRLPTRRNNWGLLH